MSNNEQASLARWRTFFSPNMVNLMSLAIGLGGFVFGIYAFLANRQNPEVSFQTTQIKVVDGSLPIQAITVNDKDGRKITGDVYGAEITLWNSGNVDFGPEKVRNPVRVTLPREAHILDSAIIGEIPKGRDSFALRGDGTDPQTLFIAWRFFDPGEGVKIRLIYSAPEQEAIKPVGALLGVSSFSEVLPYPTSTPTAPAVEEASSHDLFLWASVIMVIGGVAGMVVLRWQPRFSRTLFHTLTTAYLTICLYVILHWIFYRSFGQPPTFG